MAVEAPLAPRPAPSRRPGDGSWRSWKRASISRSWTRSHPSLLPPVRSPPLHRCRKGPPQPAPEPDARPRLSPPGTNGHAAPSAVALVAQARNSTNDGRPRNAAAWPLVPLPGNRLPQNTPAMPPGGNIGQEVTTPAVGRQERAGSAPNQPPASPSVPPGATIGHFLPDTPPTREAQRDHR